MSNKGDPVVADPTSVPLTRNDIRSAVFNERISKTVVPLDNGVSIEVRDGSVGGMLDAVSVEDVKQRMARMLVNCCYVPNTEERVFEEADFESLMELPSNGTYAKVMDVINNRMNIHARKEAEIKK